MTSGCINVQKNMFVNLCRIHFDDKAFYCSDGNPVFKYKVLANALLLSFFEGEGGKCFIYNQALARRVSLTRQPILALGFRKKIHFIVT